MNDSNTAADTTGNAEDVLVVVSKLKNYIREKSGMNTSAAVATKLSEVVRVQIDAAIERAKSDNRKTVMDRDFV
jgi:hypothetical protein